MFSNLKKYKAAIADFNRVLQINPDNVQALLNRARLLQSINDYKGALADYDKIIKLFPYFIEAYYDRSQLKRNLNDISGAEKDLETSRVMSDIFHSKNDTQLRRDSMLLANLFHLSADFNNSTTETQDTINIGFQTYFYIAEKADIVGNHSYSSLLEKINKNRKESFYFTNKQMLTINSTDSKDHNIDSSLNLNKSNVNDILVAGIRKTNQLLLNDAKKHYDNVIKIDSNNAVAYFMRGLNTCREIEMLSNLNFNHA